MNSSEKQSEETLKEEESLFNRLDPNRPELAETYRKLRQRLIVFFETRGCAAPEDLAEETIDRVVSKLPGLKPHFTGDPMTYFYKVAKNVHREYLRRRPTPSQDSDAYANPEVDSAEEDREIAPAPSIAGMFRRLLANGLLNLLTLALLVLFNRVFLIVASWISPDSGSTRQLFEYVELGVFILAVVSSLLTLLLILLGLFRLHALRRQRILSRLQVSENQFYEGMRNHVRGLLGGSI